MNEIKKTAMMGLVKAGSVQKDKLGLPPVHHAADTVAGGLGLGGAATLHFIPMSANPSPRLAAEQAAPRKGFLNRRFTSTF